MEPVPGLDHRALDLARPGMLETQPRMDNSEAGGPRLGSLGRSRPANSNSNSNRSRQPAQVVTTGSRNHIVYTDQKGRKMPYSDTTKINPTNHVRKSETLLHHQSNRNHSMKVGIYGWRKRCLYLLILGLMIMMIINLALTLWILKVMDFNLDGMGQLRIVPGGLQLLGQAMILDSLYASSLRSRRGQPITIESSRNFSIVTRNDEGSPVHRLYIGNDKIECSTNAFRITDTRGVLLFSATPDAVEVGAESLKVTGQGGAVFGGSVQTPLVRASSGNQLMLESPTRSLEMRAAQSIGIESRAGDITASCLTSLKLQSIAGSIRLEAASIFMPKLKSALPLPPTTAHSRDPHHHDIYQLCACANGKLFLASPHGICAAKEDSYICR